MKPRIMRPKLPKGYADNPASYVDWKWVAAQLTVSKIYENPTKFMF